MSRLPLRPVTAAACAVGAALLLTGCGSSGGSGSVSSGPASASSPPPSSAPATADTTVTKTAAPSNPPSGTAAGGSSGSVPARGACTNSELQISASDGDGASGHGRFVLLFHNVSGSRCTLHGYPGVDALAASGSTLAHAKRTPSGFMGGSRHGIPTVPITAGAYASATVEWETVQRGTGNACDVQSAKVAATAANTTRAVTLNRSVSACALQVHPTVPGRTGDLS